MNEPQLSAIEEMAMRYNIPLADLESLLATALEEQKTEIESKRNEAWEATIQDSELLQKVIEKKVSDERQAVIAEIDRWLDERENSMSSCGYSDCDDSIRAEFSELRAKLVEMKEGK